MPTTERHHAEQRGARHAVRRDQRNDRQRKIRLSTSARSFGFCVSGASQRRSASRLVHAAADVDAQGSSRCPSSRSDGHGVNAHATLRRRPRCSRRSRSRGRSPGF
jgi:hypothetical protein